MGAVSGRKLTVQYCRPSFNYASPGYGRKHFLIVVSVHPLKTMFFQDPKALKENILKMAASLLACGIDHEKCILFQQSKVIWLVSLWILLCEIIFIP